MSHWDPDSGLLTKAISEENLEQIDTPNARQGILHDSSFVSIEVGGDKYGGHFMSVKTSLMEEQGRCSILKWYC